MILLLFAHSAEEKSKDLLETVSKSSLKERGGRVIIVRENIMSEILLWASVGVLFISALYYNERISRLEYELSKRDKDWIYDTLSTRNMWTNKTPLGRLLRSYNDEFIREELSPRLQSHSKDLDMMVTHRLDELNRESFIDSVVERIKKKQVN